jgi:N-acetyl-anhydromuramyl-L-alanine amidase AmpD
MVAAPTIAGTSAWGARPPSSPITVLDTRPTMVIVHHTAGANSTDFSQAHAFALARAIQDYHMDHNGWIDSGQQFTISRGGFVMEGRHRSLEVLGGGTRHVRGAHCSGQNDVAVGIENEGTYITASPTTALWNSLVNMVAYICQQYSITPARIYGHRDFNNTECPGDRLYAMLPQLRDQVAAKLGDSNPPDPVTWPLVRQGDSGERVRTVQYLLRQRGYSLTVDGVFGTATDTAVRSFQTSQGLAVDGLVGSETWPKLIVTVRQGNTGDAVRAVQSQLASKGYAVTVDGLFGSQTTSAVQAFQRSRGLTADGVVGPFTWQHLVN